MKQTSHEENEITFERSSSNVFANLGLENINNLLIKTDLAHAINSKIRAQK